MAERAVVTGGIEPGRSVHDALVRSRLWIAAEAFFFLAFVFAYIYLRVLNVNGKWRLPHTKPPQVLGAVAFALIVASAPLCAVALRRLRAGGLGAWRATSVLALAMGLAAVGISGWELTHLSFSASDSAYASVFVGWTAVYALNVLLGMYWLETLVAEAFRYPPAMAGTEDDGGGNGRGRESGDVDGGDGKRGVAVAFHPAGSLGIGAEQFTGFWYFMALVGVLTYVLLYVA